MTKKPLSACLFVFFALLATVSTRAQEVHSLGLFTGLTIPYTWDGGINKDPRYSTRFDIKSIPIGVHYGVDREGHGFTFDPSMMRIGQNFNVINSTGGDIGQRDIDLTYVNIPVGIKLHIIDMSFFKVSLVASAGVGFLLNGKESIRHSDGKLKFPVEMTGPFPSAQNEEFEATYADFVEEVEYDGVIVKNVDTKLWGTEDYQKFQFFGSVGFRSDWDFSENWRASFDLRANMGILEPRTSAYTKQVKDYEALYDIYGERRDLFLSLTFGIARTLTLEHRDKEAKRKKRGTANSPGNANRKYPWPKPRNKKPKG
jgi:hypothetical protein